MGVTELNETKRNEWKNNNRASQRPSPTRTLQYKNKCKDRYSKKKLKSTCPSQQYSDTPPSSHARPVTVWWAAAIKKLGLSNEVSACSLAWWRQSELWEREQSAVSCLFSDSQQKASEHGGNSTFFVSSAWSGVSPMSPLDGQQGLVEWGESVHFFECEYVVVVVKWMVEKKK